MKMSPAGSRDSKDASSAPIPAAEVQDQVNRILASPEFRRSTRLQRFLRLAVERSLAGEIDQMKEYISWPGSLRPRSLTTTPVWTPSFGWRLNDYEESFENTTRLTAARIQS